MSKNTEELSECNLNYKTLVLSADGILGCTHLGVIMYLYKIYPLFYNDLETIIGASIGSVWGLLISMNMSMETIFKIAYDYIQHDVSRCINDVSCKQVTSRFGLSNSLYKRIRENLQLIFRCENPTFGMHYEKFKKLLVISGCNVHTMEIVYFNHITHPNMCLIDAVRISTAIPLFFEPVLYKNCLYVDPIVSERVPIGYIISSSDLKIRNSKILTICNLHEFSKLKGTKTMLHSMDIGEYIKRILFMASNKGIWDIQSNQLDMDVIHVIVNDVRSITYTLSINDIDTLVISGYETAKHTINSW